MQQKGHIGVTTENIFPIIKKFLYSDHEIFIRELVSNAVDATQKLKTLASLGEFKGETGDVTIRVSVDAEKKTLTVSDRGVGMSAEEVEKYINQIAFSGAEEFMAKYKDQANMIGHFGLGFYSSFMVADKVEIVTRSYKEGAQAVKWSCTGTPEYTLEETDKAERGTDIILYLSEENHGFANANHIESLLTKYCRFLPVPIAFGKEQEWKDGKYVDTDKDKIINDTAPLWTRKPADLKDEEYEQFYSELYPVAEPPLFHIHLNVDYPFNLTGVLYFPKFRSNFDIQKNKIQLYSNQVFVTDSVEGIVPEFLTLLHGVIDSPDIPLNVSRSYLQSDANVKKISGYITKKVADRLGEIFTGSRSEFETKWQYLKIFIEYGIITDEKFAERAKDFVLLKNTEDKYFTLDEYAALVRKNQTDKHGSVVCLYASDPVGQHSFIEAARAKGYDVLVMDGQLDSHFIGWCEHKDQKTRYVRVDSDIAEKLIEKEDAKPLSLSSAQQKILRPVFEGHLQGEEKTNYVVSFEGMGEDDLPVLITRNEYMRRMKEMAATGGGGMATFYGQMPDTYNVVVNGNHPLVIELLQQAESECEDDLAPINKKIDAARHDKSAIDLLLKDKKEADITREEKEKSDAANSELEKLDKEFAQSVKAKTRDNKLAQELIDLALLGHGLLRGEALTRFIRRSVELIK